MVNKMKIDRMASTCHATKSGACEFIASRLENDVNIIHLYLFNVEMVCVSIS